MVTNLMEIKFINYYLQYKYLLGETSAKKQFGYSKTTYAGVKMEMLVKHIARIKEFIETNGPSRNFTEKLDHINYHYNHNFQNAIDQLLKSWSNNKDLLKFINRVNEVERIISVFKSLTKNDCKSSVIEFSTFNRIRQPYKKIE